MLYFNSMGKGSCLFWKSIFVILACKSSTISSATPPPTNTTTWTTLQFSADEPGTLESRRYPNRFDKNVSRQHWTLRTAADTILVTILQIDIDPGHQSVVIRDAGGSELFSTFNVSRKGSLIRSINNEISVGFVSDLYGFGDGFVLRYIGVNHQEPVHCGEVLHAYDAPSQMTFTHSLTTPEKCSVFLDAPVNDRIRIRVIYSDLIESRDCHMERLTIYNDNRGGVPLGEFCHPRSSPIDTEIVSVGNRVLLKVKALPETWRSEVFILHYEIMRPHHSADPSEHLYCDQGDPNHSSQISAFASESWRRIISFRFDLLQHSTCSNTVFWTITKPDMFDVLQMTFDRVKLRPSPGCLSDRLTIRKGRCVRTSPIVTYVCGTTTGVYSQTDELDTTIIFNTTQPFVAWSFEMRYKVMRSPEDWESGRSPEDDSDKSGQKPWVRGLLYCVVAFGSSLVTALAILLCQKRQKRRRITNDQTQTKEPPPAVPAVPLQEPSSPQTDQHYQRQPLPQQLPVVPDQLLYTKPTSSTIYQQEFGNIPPPAVYYTASEVARLHGKPLA